MDRENNDGFEVKVLEVNNENVDEFSIDDELDFEKYQDWETPEKLDNMTDKHYIELINDSTSEAYYHDFEEDAQG